MTFLAKPLVALGFGAFFLCAATCAHFDEIGTSPLSLGPDWAAGVFLVVGAVVSGRDWSKGRMYQIAAWAFMVSLLFGSVVGNIEEWLSNTPDAGSSGLVALSQGPYLAIVSVLFFISLAGLIASLRTRDGLR
jgi:hypothetical protein